MKELTDLLEPKRGNMELGFRLGVRFAKEGVKPATSYKAWGEIRARYGLANKGTDLLTPPDANMKLDKATTPSYGLTIQHYVQKLTTGLTVNACPNAGHCVKVCVLDNGMGRYNKVQTARRAKTEFLVEHPDHFAIILGYELQRAVLKHGKILFRPNVNSDVAWERLLPSLVNGYIDGVTSYGYSKRPEVLDTDGWLGSAYRVSYSWNETSNAWAVGKFLDRGGSVAMVTSRKKGDAVGPGHVDADPTDEWMFTPGVIGDLSAKGKARKLIGKSGFVVTV